MLSGAKHCDLFPYIQCFTFELQYSSTENQGNYQAEFYF
jgi:hypothetical protein